MDPAGLDFFINGDASSPYTIPMAYYGALILQEDHSVTSLDFTGHSGPTWQGISLSNDDAASYGGIKLQDGTIELWGPEQTLPSGRRTWDGSEFLDSLNC